MEQNINQTSAELAEILTGKLFGFTPEFQSDGVEMYTKEGQEYFDEIYDAINNHLTLQELRRDTTFKNVKRYLELRDFTIHIAFQDVIANEGDDGSFGVFLTEKNNKFYVQVMSLSFYSAIRDLIICEEDDDKEGIKDYVVFDDALSACQFISRFFRCLYIVKTMLNFKEIVGDEIQEQIGISKLYSDGYYDDDNNDFRKLFENKKFNLHKLKILESIDLDTLCYWVGISIFPFSEYPEKNILKMDKCFHEIENIVGKRLHISIDIENHFNL